MRTLLLGIAVLFMGMNLEYKPNSLLNTLFAKFSLPQKKSCKIALITIDQQIYKAKDLVRALRKISLDKGIKGLILHVNSGGGKLGSCEVIFNEMKKISALIPIVTVVETACCSGAYFISCATNYIIAPAGSEVGSVGVTIPITKYSDVRFQEKNISGNSKTYVVQAGTSKDLYNPHKPIDEETLKYAQISAEESYNIFVDYVATIRNLSKNDHLIWANGQVFKGKRALELGLIDKIGDFSDGLQKIKELIAEKFGKAFQDDDIDIVDIPVQIC